MKSNPRISKILVETGAFKDLDKPVILASGLLGVYYINTEKLVQDNGAWESSTFENNSGAMIEHAKNMMKAHPTYKEVIEIMAADIQKKIRGYQDSQIAISGGQRRDWLFSGPIADLLGLSHVSLYKQGNWPDRIDVVGPQIDIKAPFYDIHVPDLLTTGSSEYRLERAIAKGWVPMLRSKGGFIDTVVGVVSRLQGAEENLYTQGIDTSAYVYIDEDFIESNAKHTVRDRRYIRDPRKFSEEFLMETGPLEFLKDFNPDNKKLDKAKAFLAQFRGFMQERGMYKELEAAVQDTYARSLASYN